MPDGAVIAFAALHFEGDFFLAAKMFKDIGGDMRIAHGRRADGEFAFVSHEQNAVKSDRLARLIFEAINFDGLARRDTILFSTSFYYCVHSFVPKGTEMASKLNARVNLQLCKSADAVRKLLHSQRSATSDLPLFSSANRCNVEV